MRGYETYSQGRMIHDWAHAPSVTNPKLMRSACRRAVAFDADSIITNKSGKRCRWCEKKHPSASAEPK